MDSLARLGVGILQEAGLLPCPLVPPHRQIQAWLTKLTLAKFPGIPYILGNWAGMLPNPGSQHSGVAQPPQLSKDYFPIIISED